jgi:hypothetical protein
MNNKIEKLPNGDFKVVYDDKPYETFYDWFHETENFAMRSERFYEEFQHMTPQRAVEWLQAVWECSRRKYETTKL